MHLYSYVRERAGQLPPSTSLQLQPDALEDRAAAKIQEEMEGGVLRDHDGKPVKSVTALCKWRERVSAEAKAASKAQAN